MSRRLILIIGLPAIAAFVAGAWFASTSSDEQSRALEQARLEQVRIAAISAARELEQHLLALYSRASSEAARPEPDHDPQPSVDPQYLHWALLHTGAPARASFLLSEGGRTILSTGDGQPWEQAYLSRINAAVAAAPRGTRQIVLRIKPDSLRATEWLSIIRWEVGRASPLAVLVDPARAARDVLTQATQLAGMRAYLVAESDGVVLAHSQPSYVGSIFARSEVYVAAARGAGLASDRGAVAPAIDRLRVALSLVPLTIEGVPTGISVGVERVIPHSLGGVAWQELVLTLFVTLFVIVFSYWAARRWLRRGEASPGDLEDPSIVVDLAGPTGQVPLQAPPEHTALQAPLQLAVERSTLAAGQLAVERTERPATQASPVDVIAIDEAIARSHPGEIISALEALPEQHAETQSARRELDATRQVLKTAREEQQFIAEFEKDAARMRDPKAVASRLTDVSSKLCASQALFFAYHEGVQAAILLADAGFAPGEAPLGMSFPIDAEAVQQIQSLEAAGQLASLAQYAPLSRLILSRLGMAHFEAWAVTGYSHLGRQSGRARLLGVLVILQSGYETVTRQESLSRIMRTTGLVYENALLSQ